MKSHLDRRDWTRDCIDRFWDDSGTRIKGFRVDICHTLSFLAFFRSLSAKTNNVKQLPMPSRWRNR